jgi:hypothetical protein
MFHRTGAAETSHRLASEHYTVHICEGVNTGEEIQGGSQNNGHDLWSLTHPDLEVKDPSFLTRLLDVSKRILASIRIGKANIEELLGKIFDASYSREDDDAVSRRNRGRRKGNRSYRKDQQKALDQTT